MAALFLCFSVQSYGLLLSAHGQTILSNRFDGINRLIPDNDSSGLTDTRAIVSSLVVTNVRVSLKITGNTARNGDLFVYLQHGGGLAVLLNRPGRTSVNGLGYGDAGFDVTFDDHAENGDIHVYRETIFGNHVTPLGGSLTDSTFGSWAPDGRASNLAAAVDTDARTASLAVFRGFPTGGEWTLFVSDAAAGGTATLVSWTLVLETEFNRPPIPQAQSLSLPEDTAEPITLNGTDPDDGVITFAIVTPPVYGTLSGFPPNVIYTPAANYFGPDSFTFTVSDGVVESAAATVSLTVTAVNDAPVAAANSYSTARDTGLTVAAPGVLANDSDVDGDALTAVLASGPAHGTLTLNSDGSFSYTPQSGFAGADAFSYRARDGQIDSGVAAVTINVDAANRSPVVVADSYPTPEDTPLNVAAPGLLANDSDPDGDTLTAILVNGPANGTLSLAGNGSFSFNPNANFTGSDSFTYRVSDGQAQSAPVTVTLSVTSVNNAPMAIGQVTSTLEDTGKAITLAGSDADSNTLTFAIVDGPIHGALSGTPPNVTYTPAANYFGPDSFTFKVSDGIVESAIATVALTVTAVNDPPVAFAQTVNVSPGGSVSIFLVGSDVEGSPLAFNITGPPTHGSLSGTAPSLIYTPNNGFGGTDQLEFTVSDGQLVSSAATVAIRVERLNNPPQMAEIPNQTTSEDILVIISLQVSDLETAAAGLTVSAVSLNPVLIPSTGFFYGGSGTNRSLGIVPAPNQNGSAIIEVTVQDPEGGFSRRTFELSVIQVNDPPLAEGGTVTLSEDQAAVVTLTGRDVDQGPLSYFVISGPSHGRLVGVPPQLVYEPAPDFSGTDSFIFQVGDGELISARAEVILIVIGGNDPPSIGAVPNQVTDEDTPLDVQFTVYDPEDLDRLQFRVESDYTSLLSPRNAELIGTGTNRILRLTPFPEQSGQTTVTLTVLDPHGATAQIQFELIVRSRNDPPLLSPLPAKTSAEDVPLLIDDIVVFDVETPMAELVVVVDSSNQTLLPQENIQLQRRGDYWQLRAFPRTNQHGSTEITITALDQDGGKVSDRFLWTVTPANDAPVAHSLRKRGDGFIELTFQGRSGQSYVLQYTDTLIDIRWESLGSARADAAGLVLFVDPIPPVRFSRFYRVVGQ